MTQSIINVIIRYDQDVVLARQRARQVAAILGFPAQDQVRVATAVSEIARNAFLYASEGRVEFLLKVNPQRELQVRVTDHGPGIPHLEQVLNGQYVSTTGMGMGILGARRLMDRFDIQAPPDSGTSVLLTKTIPPKAPPVSPAAIASQLATTSPQFAFEELQQQNQELLSIMGELERRQKELAQLNRELEDTNRGVVALYAELDEKADYLRRASELKTQFLSNMTHEFRTPLNSVLSLSRLLLDRVDGELTREQERQVKFIQRAANDLSELVNDLLDLAKVEAGKVKIRPADFQVSALFGGLRGMLRPLLAQNSSVALVIEEPSGIPVLHSDESKVSQILRNLLSNALKYTERGEVRLSCWLDSPGIVAFAVSDTGIGINPADHETIFQEFTQIEGPHQAGKKGTGLGLPLSRKLAELLGGTLGVKSEPGAGSTFTLRMPVSYQGPSEVAFVPELSKELDPMRCPVLVVEDNPETLFIYEKYLKGTGFQPVPARTLREARLALGQFRPLAIILDILLAHENTWAFLAELKDREVTRDIPVLAVTMVENEAKARGMGADEFHAKPVDRSWLLERLRKLTPSQSGDEVLLVDDDEASRYVLKGLLGDTRFRVIEAADGEEGLRLAREKKPAVIFLDVAMPGLNGFEVLKRLKADPHTAHIPVIIHTAKALTPAERKALDRSVGVILKTHTDRNASLKQIRELLAQCGLVDKAAVPGKLLA